MGVSSQPVNPNAEVQVLRIVKYRLRLSTGYLSMCSAALQTYLTKVASYTERIPVYVLQSVPAMGSLISMSSSSLKRLYQVLYVNGKPVCVRLDGPHGRRTPDAPGSPHVVYTVHSFRHWSITTQLSCTYPRIIQR